MFYVSIMNPVRLGKHLKGLMEQFCLLTTPN